MEDELKQRPINGYERRAMRYRVFLAFLLMLLLMAAAFGIGAYRAHFNEKIRIDQALESL